MYKNVAYDENMIFSIVIHFEAGKDYREFARQHREEWEAIYHKYANKIIKSYKWNLMLNKIKKVFNAN